MADIQTYGDISPRTAAKAMAPLLKRHTEKMILQKIGQTFVMPTKSTIVAKFRRYNALNLATTALVEGVTPSGQKPTITDYTGTLEQFGDFVTYTDVIMDTHEDPVLQEYGNLCVQQAAETVETLIWNKVKAGTNVFYTNGALTTVNTPINLNAQRTVTSALLRQRGQYITEIVGSSPNYSTYPIEAAFVAVCHSDVTNDVRNMEGFVPTSKYGANMKAWANEIGSVEDVRYVRSTLFTPYAGATGVYGGASTTMRNTAGFADVYTVLYFSTDAFGFVPLKGSNAMSLIAHNPGSAGSADALNQRGTLGWKTMQTAVILNDNWLGRLHCAVTL